MKIYEVTNEGESTKYCEPQLMGNWFYEPLFTNKWDDRTISLPVTMSVNNKYKPEDYPISDTYLVSTKLLEIIKTLNSDYEALPTQMYYKAKEPIWDIYYSMLFPEYKLLNWEKSKYEADTEQIIMSLDKLVLSKEKVVALPPENNLFCLKEKTTRLLCTEKAKKTIEEAGTTGIAFDELEVL